LACARSLVEEDGGAMTVDNASVEVGRSAAVPAPSGGDSAAGRSGRAPGFAGFRAGVLNLLVESRTVDTAAVRAIHQLRGDVAETFAQLDTSGDGYIDQSEMGALLQGLGGPLDALESSDVDELLAAIREVRPLARPRSVGQVGHD
jgi:hypothetical protein